MYQPGYPPVITDPKLKDLADYLFNELQSIGQAQGDRVDLIELNTLYAEPKKLRDGIIVLADGVSWQPLGAGGGFFGRKGGAWVKLNN